MKPIPVASRSAHRILGQSVVRLEDAPLLTCVGSVHTLIRKGVLPATQLMRSAPW